MKKFIITFLFLFLICTNTNANEIVNKNIKDIQKIEGYLNTVKYFSSNFIQNDNISNVLSEGKFYLSRPNKLRLEYKNPSEILLITNNKSTVYYDVELDELTKIPTKKTPIHFLTQDKFDFQNDKMEVVDFSKKENEMILSLVEKGNEKQGSISLIFQKKPMQLQGISVKNELGQEIIINFHSIVVNSQVQDKLFVFKNPKSIEEIKDRY